MAFGLDEKYIVECEKELGATLPQNYRSAMMQENGGEIETDEDTWEQYPIFDKSDRKRLSRTCKHIIAETKSCEGTNGFPENAVAIANNGFGDQMVFLKSGNKLGDKVYFWSHETGKIVIIGRRFFGVKPLITNHWCVRKKLLRTIQSLCLKINHAINVFGSWNNTYPKWNFADHTAKILQ